MAVTDYNKYIELSPTTENDSGSTIDKAQAILLTGEVTPKEFDGFEDGDYTNNPSWEETTTSGVATIQSSVVKDGNNALEIDGGGHHMTVDRENTDTISDGDIYQAWVRGDSVESTNSCYFGLTNTKDDRNGDDSAYLRLNNGSVSYATTSENDDIAVGEISNNTWYRFEIEFEPSTSTVKFRVYNGQNDLIDNVAASFSGATNIQYVFVENYEGLAYFDNVSYSVSDSSTATLSDSTTGTGDIVLDWTNISSESDIAVYDSDGNLLPYEIESFDDSNEEAVLWCYDSWVRDDSVQAQVVYGDGPGTSEEGQPWDQGQNAEMVQLLKDDPLTATDSSPEGNDGTVNGATATSGEFDGAASFDGTDDYISFGDILSPETLGTHTYLVWTNPDSLEGSVLRKGGVGSNEEFWINVYSSSFDYMFEEGGNRQSVSSSTTPSTGNWFMLAGVYDGSTQSLYVNGDSDASQNANDPGGGSDGPFTSGSKGAGDGAFYPGDVDAIRVYSEAKSGTWMQADYDASPKGGQVFFSQSAAQTTDEPGSVVETTDAGVKITTENGVFKTNP